MRFKLFLRVYYYKHGGVVGHIKSLNNSLKMDGQNKGKQVSI